MPTTWCSIVSRSCRSWRSSLLRRHVVMELKDAIDCDDAGRLSARYDRSMREFWSLLACIACLGLRSVTIIIDAIRTEIYPHHGSWRTTLPFDVRVCHWNTRQCWWLCASMGHSWRARDILSSFNGTADALCRSSSFFAAPELGTNQKVVQASSPP